LISAIDQVISFIIGVSGNESTSVAHVHIVGLRVESCGHIVDVIDIIVDDVIVIIVLSIYAHTGGDVSVGINVGGGG
jgi:hypothetical protein